MIILRKVKADEFGLAPIAKIKASGLGACYPTIMGLSPVPAVNKFAKLRAGKE